MDIMLKYLTLLLLTLPLLACGKPNLASCLENIEEARNSYPLKPKEKDSDIIQAIDIDQKYAKCFVKRLGIQRSDPIRKQVQKILDYTSTDIIYEEDKKEALSDDLNRPGTKLPSRTVVDGKGDCEDKSALAAIMLNELGITTFLIKRQGINNGLGHIFLGIKADYNTDLKCADDYLIAFDPTIKGAKLGDREDGLKSFKCVKL